MEDLGMFVGVQKECNNEAVFFKNLNEWVMAQCGARWDTPGATKYLLENEFVLPWIDSYLLNAMDGPRSVGFLGVRRYLKNRGITRIDEVWGWKDPRNTFTLPHWLRIFPEAKVLYIERHGVDVAQSLLLRNRKVFEYSTSKYSRMRSLMSVFPKRGGFIGSPRCDSLAGGLSLWKEYTDYAECLMDGLSSDQVFRVRYEDLLKNPVSIIKPCAEFCGLDVSIGEINALASGINDNRAYSYLKQEELKRFALNNQAILSARGY
jgi:hypothetical protein